MNVTGRLENGQLLFEKSVLVCNNNSMVWSALRRNTAGLGHRVSVKSFLTLFAENAVNRCTISVPLHIKHHGQKFWIFVFGAQ
jgi:hypothetical protein